MNIGLIRPMSDKRDGSVVVATDLPKRDVFCYINWCIVDIRSFISLIAESELLRASYKYRQSG